MSDIAEELRSDSRRQNICALKIVKQLPLHLLVPDVEGYAAIVGLVHPEEAEPTALEVIVVEVQAALKHLVFLEALPGPCPKFLPLCRQRVGAEHLDAEDDPGKVSVDNLAAVLLELFCQMIENLPHAVVYSLEQRHVVEETRRRAQPSVEGVEELREGLLPRRCLEALRLRRLLPLLVTPLPPLRPLA